MVQIPKFYSKELVVLWNHPLWTCATTISPLDLPFQTIDYNSSSEEIDKNGDKCDIIPQLLFGNFPEAIWAGGRTAKQMQLNLCQLNKTIEQEVIWTKNYWTTSRLYKKLLDKKSIEKLDNWTNFVLNEYLLNRNNLTKSSEQLNKLSIERLNWIPLDLAKMLCEGCNNIF